MVQMAEMFPVKRFTTAGATKDEREQLKREFERSDLSIQQGMVEHFKAQSTSGLRDYLDNLREMGHFTDAPERVPELDSGDSDSELDEAPKKTGKSALPAESIEDDLPESSDEE